MLRRIEKALNTVTTPVSIFGRHLAGILLLIMVAIVLMQVFARFILNSPLDWSDEASRFLMIYMTYLCLPFVYLINRNISMTFITEMLENKAKRLFYALILFGHSASILVFSIWIWFGWNFFKTGSVMADSLPISMYVIYAVPPVMMMVTTVFALQKIVTSLRGIIGDYEDVSNIKESENYHDYGISPNKENVDNLSLNKSEV